MPARFRDLKNDSTMFQSPRDRGNASTHDLCLMRLPSEFQSPRDRGNASTADMFILLIFQEVARGNFENYFRHNFCAKKPPFVHFMFSFFDCLQNPGQGGFGPGFEQDPLMASRKY